MTFLHFLDISTSQKLEMFTFSGSTNLWGILENYEPLHVLLQYYKGTFECVKGPKIEIYDFWALPVHFHIKKVRNEYIF